MGEQVALGFLQPLMLPLCERIKEELRVASDAETELQNLKSLKAPIDDFLKEAQLEEKPSEMLKAGIAQMQQFLSDSRSAMEDYGRNGNLTCIPNRITNHAKSRDFVDKARDAKQKLMTCLGTLNTMATALGTLHQLPGHHAQASSAGYRSSSIAYSQEKNEVLVGIKGPKDQLRQLLTENNLRPKVIFVHGAQGVGKTSLVGAVLRDQRVRPHFKNYVWFKDLRSCELAEHMEGALEDADAKRWDPNKDDEEEDMKLTQVFKFIGEDINKRSPWVLVLDDASRSDVFKSLKTYLSETHPIVLVTTRISNLASSSEPHLASLRAQSDDASSEPSEHLYVFHNFKHAVLSMDDSHKLFCQKMPARYNCENKPRVYFDSILEKCGRLPLAILAMCEHVIHKQGGDNVPQFVEWEKWSGSLLFSSLSNYEENGPIRRMITKCMDHSRDFQDSVLYLSCFPLDCPLRYSTLMRLWIAEEFPEETLRKLVEHNIFQDVRRTSYGRFGTCHVNTVLHQIIISKSLNDDSQMIVAGQREDWRHTIQRLSFHSAPKSEVEGMRLEQLISLHVFREVCQKSMKKLLGQVDKLKVLNLQRHLTKVEKDLFRGSWTFPREILHLKYVRYLSLRDTKVQKIPDEIGNLGLLETLDLKGTAVTKLPGGIVELKRLRHLLVYRSDKHLAGGINPKHGVKAPSKFGDLKLLQKLYMIELEPVDQSTRRKENKKRRMLLKEIGKLTNLKRLGVSALRSYDVELLFSSIEKLTNLEALRLIAAREEKIDLSNLDVRKIPTALRRVHLIGCFRTSPNRTLSLTGVVKLVLKGSQLDGDPLQHLHELRHLKHLELQQAFDGTELRFTAQRFLELRFLGLDKIDSLRSIIVESGALQALETLSLARCKSLKRVSQHVTCFKELKCLKLYGMPEKFKSAVKRNGNVPAHIKVECKEWKEETVEEPIKRPTNGARRFSWLFKFKNRFPLRHQHAMAPATATLYGTEDCISTSPA